jgi:hypothetical protein
MRPLRIGDRVTIASQSQFPKLGTVRLLHVRRHTARVEWDGMTIDKGPLDWRGRLPEELIAALRFVPPDTCPTCNSPLQLTSAIESVAGATLAGGAWRRPVSVVACSACEFVKEV